MKDFIITYALIITLAFIGALGINACGQDPEAERIDAETWACTFEMSDPEIAELNRLNDLDAKGVWEACRDHVKGKRHLMTRDEWEEALEAQRLEDEANGLNY